jgi:hypothetical protein
MEKGSRRTVNAGLRPRPTDGRRGLAGRRDLAFGRHLCGEQLPVNEPAVRSLSLINGTLTISAETQSSHGSVARAALPSWAEAGRAAKDNSKPEQRAVWLRSCWSIRSFNRRGGRPTREAGNDD